MSALNCIAISDLNYPLLPPGGVNPREIDAKQWPTVHEVMSSDPVSIDITATLKEAVDLMVSEEVGNLVVRNGASFGLLTERELLESLAVYGRVPDKLMGEMLLSKFSKVAPNTSIIDAAAHMLSSKTRLLVYDSDRLVGIITTSDLLRALYELISVNRSLAHVISRDVQKLEHYSSIKDAIKLMVNKRIGSVLVTVDGLYDGIFTERDLLRILRHNVSLTSEVGNYCSPFMIAAREGATFARDAAKLMLANKIKRLPLTHNGKVVGIVTARDVVEALVHSELLVS